jgi:hypothetical protein
VLQKRRSSSSVAQAVAQRTPVVASRGFAEAAPRRAVGRSRRGARGCQLAFSTSPPNAGGEEGAAASVGDGELESGYCGRDGGAPRRRQVNHVESRLDGEGGGRRWRPYRAASDLVIVGPASLRWGDAVAGRKRQGKDVPLRRRPRSALERRRGGRRSSPPHRPGGTARDGRRRIRPPPPPSLALAAVTSSTPLMLATAAGARG